jgi:hypothetical protein
MNMEKIKPLLAGAAGGAVVLAIIGFMWGGWLTSSTAMEMGEEMARNAVVARLAPICVEQFNRDPEKAQNLSLLKEKNAWERGAELVKHGSAIMPGEKEADSNVAGKCAELLVAAAK